LIHFYKRIKSARQKKNRDERNGEDA